MNGREEPAAAELMSRLAPADEAEQAPDTERAYQRLRVRARANAAPTGRGFIASMEGVPLMQRITGAPRRAAAVGVIIVALMVGVIAFAPVSTLANNFINSLRIQQFAAITVPMDLVGQFDQQAKSVTPQDVQSMMTMLQNSKDFSTTFSPKSLHVGGTVQDAKTRLGGSIEVPSNLPSGFSGTQPQVFTSDAGSTSFTVDVAKADQLLQKLSLNVQGLPDPTTTPKVTFSVDVPAAAALAYTSGNNHLVVLQMQSPTLNIPSTVDINELRDTILSIPGLPTDMVAQIKAVHDWQHTLIIPVPSGATTAQKTVNGAPALLISDKDGAVVLWQKDGVLYAVGGNGLSSDAVMSVAGSMQAQ